MLWFPISDTTAYLIAISAATTGYMWGHKHGSQKARQSERGERGRAARVERRQVDRERVYGWGRE